MYSLLPPGSQYDFRFLPIPCNLSQCAHSVVNIVNILFVLLSFPVTVDTQLAVLDAFGASNTTRTLGPHDSTSVTGVGGSRPRRLCRRTWGAMRGPWWHALATDALLGSSPSSRRIGDGHADMTSDHCILVFGGDPGGILSCLGDGVVEQFSEPTMISLA